jgi:hypothetical protein
MKNSNCDEDWRNPTGKGKIRLDNLKKSSKSPPKSPEKTDISGGSSLPF